MIQHVSTAQVAEMTPREAWSAMIEDDGAILVDVRSRPEWSFAGMPDLSSISREVWTVEWQTWPEMSPNLGFLSDLEAHMGEEAPTKLYFMCRMGTRGLDAARAVAKQMHGRGVNLHICNIVGGFEGDHNPDGQRGRINGWKAEGLPWRQA